MINIKSVIPSEHAFCVTHSRVTAAVSYHAAVTVYDIRLRNLQKLVDDFESPRNLADHTGADEAHIKQILKGGTLPSGKRKNVGNDLARRLDDRCCLGQGWMDMPHDEKPAHPEELRLAADEQMIIALYRRASPELRKLIRIAAELAREDETAKERAEKAASQLDSFSTRRKTTRAKKKTGTND